MVALSFGRRKARFREYIGMCDRSTRHADAFSYRIDLVEDVIVATNRIASRIVGQDSGFDTEQIFSNSVQ